MTAAEFKLDQALAWLSDTSGNHEIEICLSLPECDWSTLVTADRSGDNLIVTAKQGFFGSELRELICNVSDLAAVRRRPSTRIDDILGTSRSREKVDDDLPF